MPLGDACAASSALVVWTTSHLWDSWQSHCWARCHALSLGGALQQDTTPWPVCADHLTKGRLVGISGRLDHSEWTDDQGERHSRYKIVATTIDFLGRPDTTEADS